MAHWLQDWGEEVPATMNDHAHGDHSAGGSADDTGADLPGMASADEIVGLQTDEIETMVEIRGS